MTQPSKPTRASLHFTPTERRVLNVLLDGNKHPTVELLKCLEDQASLRAVHFQISMIRKKLETVGETIAVELYGRKAFYRWVSMDNIPD